VNGDESEVLVKNLLLVSPSIVGLTELLPAFLPGVPWGWVPAVIAYGYFLAVRIAIDANGIVTNAVRVVFRPLDFLHQLEWGFDLHFIAGDVVPVADAARNTEEIFPTAFDELCHFSTPFFL